MSDFAVHIAATALRIKIGPAAQLGIGLPASAALGRTAAACARMSSTIPTPAKPHSPMSGAFPPSVVPLAMKVAIRCNIVVFANAVYWAAVENPVELLKLLKPVSYLRSAHHRQCLLRGASLDINHQKVPW